MTLPQTTLRLMVLVISAGLLMPADADPVKILDKDFSTMMRWFPGIYDNQEQVYFEGELDVPEDLRHERIHHVFHRVELPAFGDNVFYVQQHLDDDPAKIYRQRIYTFVPDYEENAIRLTIYTPNDVDALIDAHEDPSKLAGLAPEQTRTIEGCEVFWKRQANQFIGYMKEDACSFESKRSGKRIFINDDLVLTEYELWISDRAKDAEGNHVFGHKTGEPHKNRKARPFKCWASVKQADDEWYFKSNIEIHDQGGFVWLTTEEPEPQKVGIKLRNVVWPYGRNRPSLVVYAYRDTPDRAVSYAWADPEARRVGLNLRWMQASCTLVE